MQNSRLPVEPTTQPPSSAGEYWRLLLEYCPGAIAMLDRELRYLLVSRRWRDEFQLGDRALEGCSHSEVFSLTDDGWRIYTRCLTDGSEHFWQEERVGVDGHTDLWQWGVACWRDGTGAIGGLILTTEKITRQQQEAQYRSIFEAVSDGLCISDLETGQTVAVNPAMCRMHGYSEAEFLSLSPNHFVHPDSLPLFARYLETVKARQPFYCQAVDIRKNGSLFDVEVNGTLCLYNGKIHGLAVVRDITEQQAARRDRKRANAQLREKEQFLRSIYDGVECAIFVVDVQPNGEFLYNSHNRAAEIRTGQRSLDVAGKPPTDAFGAAEGQAISQFFARCVMAKTSITEVEQLTFDGETGWSMTTLNPLFDQNGKVYRIVGTSFDITDLKKTQAQLKQQAIALEQTLQELQRTQSQMLQSEKMSSLGQLVAGVAHEINNPVNFIFGNLKHANDYTQDLLELIQLYQTHHPHPHPDVQAEIEAIDLEFLVEDLPKLLNSMKVGAERIQKIVASLRTFSRMDEAEMKAVDIHEGINSTLMILQNRLKARHDRPDINIIKQYGKLPLVECYAGQLNQVFMNVLSNGIDALEEACLTHRITDPAITISTELLPSKEVRITIADNGLGMPEKVRQRLFDPFFTTKPVGKGTGMGLSISYQIVTEKHGGSLTCHSQPGQGAEFTIQIPLHQK